MNTATERHPEQFTGEVRNLLTRTGVRLSEWKKARLDIRHRWLVSSVYKVPKERADPMEFLGISVGFLNEGYLTTVVELAPATPDTPANDIAAYLIHLVERTEPSVIQTGTRSQR